MKKSFQIIRDISAPDAGNTKTFTERAKQNFARVTGVFVTPADALTDLTGVTMSLKIAGQEILPKGFDVELITLRASVSRAEVTYDFTNDQIPARSSEVEVTIESAKSGNPTFNIYLVVEN